MNKIMLIALIITNFSIKSSDDSLEPIRNLIDNSLYVSCETSPSKEIMVCDLSDKGLIMIGRFYTSKDIFVYKGFIKNYVSKKFLTSTDAEKFYALLQAKHDSLNKK